MQIKSGSVCLYRVDTVFWAAPVTDLLLCAAPLCVMYSRVVVHFVRAPAVDEKKNVCAGARLLLHKQLSISIVL